MGKVFQKRSFLQAVKVFPSTNQPLWPGQLQVLWCADSDGAQVYSSQEGELTIFVQRWRGYSRWFPPLLRLTSLPLLIYCRHPVQQKSQSGEKNFHLGSSSLVRAVRRCTLYSVPSLYSVLSTRDPCVYFILCVDKIIYHRDENLKISREYYWFY